MNILTDDTDPNWVKTVRPEKLPESTGKDRIALFLQGGGALGAYQAGVYAALSKMSIEPDWVAGISIGAINGAIIAGNKPENRLEKLREFWDYIAIDYTTAPLTQTFINDTRTLQHNVRVLNPYLQPEVNTPQEIMTDEGETISRRHDANLNAYYTALHGVPHFFGKYASGNQRGAIYDTSPLEATLRKFIDFDYLNSDKAPRYSAGAVNVETREVVYFDNKGAQYVSEPKRGVLLTPQLTEECRIGPEHIMASAALGPQFPTIKIPDAKGEDRYFWDAGLVTNTPARWAYVTGQLDDKTSIIRADLHDPAGKVPKNMVEAKERAIDLKFSSPELGIKQDEVAAMINVVCKKRELQSDTKGFDFSPIAIRENFNAGMEDMLNALALRLGKNNGVEAVRRIVDKGQITDQERYLILHSNTPDAGKTGIPR